MNLDRRIEKLEQHAFTEDSLLVIEPQTLEQAKAEAEARLGRPLTPNCRVMKISFVEPVQTETEL